MIPPEDAGPFFMLFSGITPRPERNNMGNFLLCEAQQKWPCAVSDGTALKSKRVSRDGPHAQNYMRSGAYSFMQDTKHAAFERMMMEVPRKRDASNHRERPMDREKKNPCPQKAGEQK